MRGGVGVCFSFAFSSISCCHDQQNKRNAHVKVKKLHMQTAECDKEIWAHGGEGFWLWNKKYCEFKAELSQIAAIHSQKTSREIMQCVYPDSLMQGWANLSLELQKSKLSLQFYQLKVKITYYIVLKMQIALDFQVPSLDWPLVQSVILPLVFRSWWKINNLWIFLFREHFLLPTK